VMATSLRGKRARAQCARFLAVGGGLQPCGAPRLRVAASHQFACG
jgi:hypothetical protein